MVCTVCQSLSVDFYIIFSISETEQMKPKIYYGQKTV